MTLVLLAYFGGVLTIVSPCILPVLPFVFARASLPFLRSGLPMLLGMAITFALVAALAAVGGSWAVRANEYGRYAALLLLAVFGISLLFPALADRMARPFVSLGARLSASAEQRADGPSFWSSLLLGVGTGLLWAPCAGPILGLILTGAALNGANIGTLGLLLAYSLGAATSLALALLIGGRIFAAMKRSLGVGEWVRRGLGALVLLAVVAIALGLDTGVLTRLSTAGTSGLEQSLLDRIKGRAIPPDSSQASTDGATQSIAAGAPGELTVEGTLPSLDGAVAWLNSPPLTADGLRGKVVLIDFWTYSCVNCLRTLPYVRAWAEKYKDAGLVVIGVHTPEFAFEKNVDNVKRAVGDLGITYPVAVDNGYDIWRAFRNEYWPAHYFIDAQGRIRHHHFGEGSYAESETVIQQLLAEAGANGVASGVVAPEIGGAALAPVSGDVQSPETYVGYDRAERMVSPGGARRDETAVYTAPILSSRNEWALSGSWRVGAEKAAALAPGAGIRYRFHARDLNLVLGPGTDGKPVRFRVLVDGKAPGADRGMDIDSEGSGTIDRQRLFQLIRNQGAIGDRTFDIEFLDAGGEAFAFTFG